MSRYDILKLVKEQNLVQKLSKHPFNLRFLGIPKFTDIYAPREFPSFPGTSFSEKQLHKTANLSEMHLWMYNMEQGGRCADRVYFVHNAYKESLSEFFISEIPEEQKLITRILTL